MSESNGNGHNPRKRASRKPVQPSNGNGEGQGGGENVPFLEDSVGTLTPRQSRFVEEYVISLNATDAYRKVYGSSQQVAEANGSRLIGNAKVAAAVQWAIDARSRRTQITQDRVLAELGRVGFSDMRSFAKWGARGVSLKEDTELDEDAARCVAEVSQTVSKEGGSIKFKLHDKVGALEKIGRHLGMFVDRVEDVTKRTPAELEKRVLTLVRTAVERKKAAGAR